MEQPLSEDYSAQKDGWLNNTLWVVETYDLNQIASPRYSNKYTRTIQFIWRIFACLSLLGLLIAGLIYSESIEMFKAFTIWSLTLTSISFGLMLSNTFANSNNETQSSKFLWKISLLVFTIILTAEVIVTVVFWALLYSKENDPGHIFDNVDRFNLRSFHILPLLYLVIDFLTNNWILVYSHSIFIVAYILIYGIFNFAWVMISGNYIYPILTWKDVLTYLYAFGIVIAVLLIHIFMTWLSRKLHSPVVHRTATLNSQYPTHSTTERVRE